MRHPAHDFHAFVYFDERTRPAAERLYDALAAQFDVPLSALHAQANGAHAGPMFQITIPHEHFASVVPWLMTHHGELSVLVQDVGGSSPMWMGSPPLPVSTSGRSR